MAVRLCRTASEFCHTAKLHALVVMKGGLFPNGRPHIAAFSVRPPYDAARYRVLRLSPPVIRLRWIVSEFLLHENSTHLIVKRYLFTVCVYYFYDQIAYNKILILIMTIIV